MVVEDQEDLVVGVVVVMAALVAVAALAILKYIIKEDLWKRFLQF
jgi:hypothetical protein